MKIALRDDDTCFYTKVSDLDILRSFNIPVSLSVTPFAVPNHGTSMHFGKYPIDIEMPISANKELCEYLKNKVKNNDVEILLHGYNHKYLVSDGKVIPEMIWKNEKTLLKEVGIGKTYLEQLFNTKINIFVAPSQAISKKGIRAIEKYNLNYSGMITRIAEREITFSSFKYLLLRFVNRILYGFSFQGLMKYKKHLEYGIFPVMQLDEMIRLYNICKKRNYNMSIVTHYWQLNTNSETINNLKNFINYVKNDGVADFVFLSELFE